jgi:hypothetical protein
MDERGIVLVGYGVKVSAVEKRPPEGGLAQSVVEANSCFSPMAASSLLNLNSWWVGNLGKSGSA